MNVVIADLHAPLLADEERELLDRMVEAELQQVARRGGRSVSSYPPGRR